MILDPISFQLFGIKATEPADSNYLGWIWEITAPFVLARSPSPRIESHLSFVSSSYLRHFISPGLLVGQHPHFGPKTKSNDALTAGMFQETAQIDFYPKIEGSTPTPMMALSVGICVPDSSFIMNWNGSNGYLSSNRPIEIFAEVKLVTGPRPTTPGSLPRQILLTMATWWEMSQPTIGVNQPKNLDEATKSETQLTQKTIPTTLTAETQQIVSSKKVVGSSWISWYSRPGCRYLK